MKVRDGSQMCAVASTSTVPAVAGGATVISACYAQIPAAATTAAATATAAAFVTALARATGASRPPPHHRKWPQTIDSSSRVPTLHEALRWPTHAARAGARARPGRPIGTCSHTSGCLHLRQNLIVVAGTTANKQQQSPRMHSQNTLKYKVNNIEGKKVCCRRASTLY
jgi:hypothetical protein